LPDPDIALAEGFPPATRADWLALVEKTLKGAGPETLVSQGAGGLSIQPLYARATAPEEFTPGRRGGARAWDIRALTRSPTRAGARAALLEDLAGGAASAIVALDDGDGGAPVDSADGLAEVLDGVLIDVAPIALQAGFLGPQAADWLSATAKGSPAAPLAFHLDPLSTFAARGASAGPIEAHLAAAANAAARLAPIHPRASLFLASGVVVHETGGSPAEELAFALAAALAYAKALIAEGVGMEDAFAAVVLGLAADGDPLISVAKLRAARLAWARLTGACGSEAPATIEARSSRRMLTKADPWTNMVRLTAAGFAAAVGGADAIVLGTFTDALGLPTAFARRTARNTQLILMEEGHLGAVSDPVAGSGAFEVLSADIARGAWARFTAIETAGGLVTALRDGLIAGEARASRAVLKAALADGGLRLVGVTDFIAPETRPAAVEPPPTSLAIPPDTRLPGPDSQCPPLTPVSLEDLAR
jgi:methylmalonyl-CoA mutase